MPSTWSSRKEWSNFSRRCVRPTISFSSIRRHCLTFPTAGFSPACRTAPSLHLTGINADLTAHSPLKILLDDIREWATQRGLQTFHLGGGLGGREDSLFEFERRFSPITHTFRTGRWVLNTGVYRELAANHRDDLIERGCSTDLPDYFPIYRYQPVEIDAMPVPR